MFSKEIRTSNTLITMLRICFPNIYIFYLYEHIIGQNPSFKSTKKGAKIKGRKGGCARHENRRSY